MHIDRGTIKHAHGWSWVTCMCTDVCTWMLAYGSRTREGGKKGHRWLLWSGIVAICVRVRKMDTDGH